LVATAPLTDPSAASSLQGYSPRTSAESLGVVCREGSATVFEVRAKAT